MNLRTTLAAAAAVMTVAGGALAQDQGETYDLQFQSSDEAGTPNFQLQKEWATRVGQMSDGRIQIDMVPVGSVVAYSETLDAVSSGILDGQITDPSYFTGRDPAFGLIANPIGAWSSVTDMLRFYHLGPGHDLMNELYHPYGIQFIGAAASGVESFVSKVPLDRVADLKGLKMRAPEGLVQDIFAAAGAAPVNLPQSEIFTSLDKGVIDAADFTVFATNAERGVNDIAPNPVYPGFSLPLIEVSMTKQTWDSMSDDLHAILETSVRAFGHTMSGTLALKDKKAVAKARANPDITVHDWSEEERAKFRAIALKEWKKIAQKSENAQKVYNVLTSYLDEQGMLPASESGGSSETSSDDTSQ